jgi:uncharacterized protein (TIGR02099 family)
MSLDRKFKVFFQCWLKLRTFWRGWGRRIAAWVINTLGVLLALFAIVLLITRYILLPQVANYKPEIETMVSQALGGHVTIAALNASWRGLNPQLDIQQLVVQAPNGEPALALPQVQATLSWRSLLVAGLRLKNLTLVDPDVSIVRQVNGQFLVAGLTPTGNNDGAGLEWLLDQQEIVVQQGRIRWRDEMRGSPELMLHGVNLVLQNEWLHHRLSIQASPPADLAGPLDIRADFTHPVIATQISDMTRWKGTLYVDVKDTDLAIWPQYIDLPVTIRSGVGSLRAWLDVDNSHVENFSADLDLVNLSVTLAPTLQPLALRKVQGRVSASETGGLVFVDGYPSFGHVGHRVSLENFTLETMDGLQLNAASLEESYTAATEQSPEQVRLSVSALDLNTLSALAQRLPLTISQRRLLTDLSPSGTLRDFTLAWSGSYPDISAYRLVGHFDGLSVKPQPFRAAKKATASQAAVVASPAMPGVENLNGYIDASETEGKLIIDASNASLQIPAWLASATVPFDTLKAQAHWTVQNNETLVWTLDDFQFALPGAKGQFQGTHRLPLNAPSLGHVDVSGMITSFDVSTIGRYLPTATPADLKHWLTGALVAGTAEDIQITLKGDLADFPFNHVTATASPQMAESQFLVTGKFRDFTMNYEPGEFSYDGRSPAWPLLTKAQGTLKFDRTRMEIVAHTGQTQGATVSDVHATIADLSAHDAVLEIEGNAQGSMAQLLDYVVHSPVAGWMSHFTEDTQATGKGKLHLAFQMPIEHPHQTRVQGRVDLLHNNVDLIADLPTIYNATGAVKFNESGFTLENIKGRFLGGAVHVSGGTQADHTIAVKAHGVMQMDGVRAAYPQTELAGILNHALGETPYAVDIQVKDALTSVTVDSSLRGISLDLPAPLYKSAMESLPTRFVLRDIVSTNPLMLQDEMVLSVGKKLSAYYLRQKLPGSKNYWEVLRGGLGVQHEAPRPDSGVTAYVDVEALNLDAWSQFHSTMGAGGSAMNTQQSALSGYIPTALVARTETLTLLDRTLNHVVFGASREDGVWQANIDAEQINGYATWNEPRGRGDLGKVMARLTKLVIPESIAEKSKEVLKTGNAQVVEIPDLDVQVEDFQLFDMKLGSLAFKASTSNTPAGQVWHIKELRLTNPFGKLASSGEWVVAGDKSRTNVQYAVEVIDAGQLLARFGVPGQIQGGKGKIDGNISWQGSPFAFDIPSLSGKITLDVKNGQFLKIEPGAARLLAVLSLQSLPRRLSLDFRDIFSEGFAFDDINGVAHIAHGVVSTETLRMQSVLADVLMKGSANIAKETQDITVKIIPDVSLGTASVVAMAVNPFVGLGGLLAQFFLGDKIKESLSFDYAVTGSWRDPIVTKLEKGASVRSK